MNKATEFEQLVERIYRSLNPELKVKRNEMISDPDVGVMRQIDVAIYGEDLKIFVECRDRTKAQDVQWIEELIGRKTSLRPDLLIGVSRSGFSSTAIAKAAAHGILLRNFNDITCPEIASWGSKVELEIRFVRFKQISIGINNVPHPLANSTRIFELICGNGTMSRQLTAVALSLKSVEEIGSVACFEDSFKTSLSSNSEESGFEIEVKLTGFASLESTKHKASGVLLSGPAGQSVGDHTMAEFAPIGNELHIGARGGFWFVDMSSFKFDVGCYPAGDIRLDCGEPMSIRGVQISGFEPVGRIIPNCSVYEMN